MRLAIGTAQFGLGYGVANTRGRVPAEDVAAILAEARAAGCDTIDTAIGYGDAERVLGDIGVGGWRVVTKLPAVPVGESDVASWVFRQVEGSLGRLRATALHGLLLHRPDQLLSSQGPALARALESVKTQGLVTCVGVSVAAPQDVVALSKCVALDLVQVPFNVFDRRLLADALLDRLVAAGTEVHVRSVFLQGLLVMAPERRPVAFDRWAALFRQYDCWSSDAGLTPVAACLRDAMAQPGISRVVVGLDGLAQWREVVRAAVGEAAPRPSSFDRVDAELIDPLVWLSYPPEQMRVR